MNRPLSVAVLVVLGAVVALQNRSAAQAPVAPPPTDSHRALVDRYCVGCHSARLKAGGLALEGLKLNEPWKDAAVWERALRKLRGNLMPPPGLPQPPQREVEEFVAWLENQLDSHAQGPTAGRVPMQRMNRTEYAAAVKALVGVEVDPQEILPQDISVQGFDNIASALTVSPAFLEQYVTAARKIAALAVGDPRPPVTQTKYSVADAALRADLPLPLGTRGGIRFRHNFPADGEYRFSILDLGVGLYVGNMENAATLVILVDGAMVFRGEIGGPGDLALANRKGADGRAEIMKRFTNIPVEVQAGVRDVVVAFIDRPHVESPENVSGGNRDSFGYAGTRMARLADGVTIAGPYHPTGIRHTPSRAKIFVCDPEFVAAPQCARQITANLARLAFRRPVTAEDLGYLMPFYEQARARGASFDEGIEKVVAAVLASPDFLYRYIEGVDGRLTDLELASRLSFFLWSSGPDAELLELAEAGSLSQPAVLEAQVRRMLADPKAVSLVRSFAMKWLDLDDLDSVVPDPEIFPGFNAQLRRDMEKETELFLADVLLKNRSVLDLLSSEETFLNERLARHYGIEGVYGNQFRRVKLAQKERAGLLGKAAVLMRTSYGDRTSPVLRGAWVLDKLMGTPPAPPPPNVEANLNQPAGEKPKTVRARLELHREAAACKQCHGVIDPIGLALENFDSIGRWRLEDAQAKERIDAATVLPNGVAINGPVELRAQMLSRPEMFVRALTEKLLMYALNRELEYFDMPQVRKVAREAAKDNYTLASIVLGIVNTDAFRKQAPATVGAR
jgi:mono/diheme cytochrome c family protein